MKKQSIRAKPIDAVVDRFTAALHDRYALVTARDSRDSVDTVDSRATRESTLEDENNNNTPSPLTLRLLLLVLPNACGLLLVLMAFTFFYGADNAPPPSLPPALPPEPPPPSPTMQGLPRLHV